MMTNIYYINHIQHEKVRLSRFLQGNLLGFAISSSLVISCYSDIRMILSKQAYYKMRVLAFLIIFLALTFSHAFILEESSALPFAADIQGFPQIIGRSFGEEKVDTLIKFINEASTLYRDDFEKNLKYIQANMQVAFGSDEVIFSVLIQSNSTPSATNKRVFSQYGDTYASFSSGINMINPTWSYFVYILKKFQTPFKHEYIPQIGQSKSMTIVTINAFKEIVLKNDGKGACTCNKVYEIAFALEAFDSNWWNVVCHSSPITEGYAMIVEDQWLSAKPYSCYYMIYPIYI